MTFGPQVTARPGTKRHLKQLRARAVFLAIISTTARGELKRATAAREQAEAALNAATTRLLTIATPVGNA